MQFRNFGPARALGVNVALGAVIIAGGVWAYQTVWGSGAASASPSSAIRRGSVAVADVSETVSTSATVASSNVVTANFTSTGTVTKIYVKLGDLVTKGRKLARIDATSANQQLTTAEDNLTAAQDSLSRAKESGDTAAIDTAQTQVDAAQDSLDTAQANVDGTVLYAPITGTIIAQNGVVGASSSSGSTGASASSSNSSNAGGFMQIADLTKMEVDADFPEADATKLKAGQAAKITWNALSDATAAGEVSSIDPTATTSNGVVTYGVVVQLTSLPTGIRIGQTTTVVVTIASKKSVLAVPSTAVTTVGGISFVQVIANGVTTRTRVEIGLAGDSLTEVTSGLTEGQEVVLPAATTSSTSNNPFANLGGGGLGGLGGLGGGGFVRGGTGGSATGGGK